MTRILPVFALLLAPALAFADVHRHASLPVATRDGRVIAFQSDRDGPSHLFVMGADGKNELRITNTLAEDMGPDWNEDGSVLVFASWNGENAPMKIETIRADGTLRRTVFAAKGKNEVSWPRFSPDGKQIAFNAAREDGGYDIMIVDADGSHPRKFESHLRSAWNPAWSPDGKQLAFTDYSKGKATTESRTKLYVANLDGDNRRLVTVLPGVAQLPRWSHDGKRIALQTYDGSKDINILVVDAGRGDYKFVTHHARPPYGDETPSWLPDGTLLFQSNRDGVMHVYRMTADGKKQFRLTR
jgi:TolB protein